jgi:hypothetical protein
VKVFYGLLGASGATAVLFSLLMLWIAMAPTSDEFYERDMRISKALDEVRIKGLEAERDLKLKELDTARMLEIESDALRGSIVSDFKNKIGSRTRAQDETRIKNTKDRQQRLTVAGLGLLASLLITAYSIWRFRAEKRAGRG